MTEIYYFRKFIALKTKMIYLKKKIKYKDLDYDIYR